MAYDKEATSRTPALIIYLLDASASMAQPLGAKRRIEVVTDALSFALREMVFRSTKGIRVAPRYHVAMFAYSDRVHDLLGGIQSIDHIVAKGVPQLSTLRTTFTAKAFEHVEHMLERELPARADCPAPLVCHMTDGEYTGSDPEPVVRRIMGMQTRDGNVLVENIFISDDILEEPISDPKQWPGVVPGTKLKSEYARKLRDLSSVLPESYRAMMRADGYAPSREAVMMLPGTSPELVRMGFVMSAATPIARET